MRLNGRRVVRASERVGAEDQIVVAEQAARERTPSALPHRPPGLDIVYEDADVLVVDKPTGLLTSTVPRERRPTLLALVRAHADADRPPGSDHSRRVGLIHRLDRDASGLLVFSKTQEAYRSLKDQFFDHSVERFYTAVVEGVPTPRAARVETRLVERADGTVYSTRRPGEGERAVTEYEVIEEGNRRSMLRVKLHTGRKHQIRVHLSQRATPIVGDMMYGRAAAPPTRRRPPVRAGGERLMLAATRLSFTHPRTGQRVTFERGAPESFAAALREGAAPSR